MLHRGCHVIANEKPGCAGRRKPGRNYRVRQRQSQRSQPYRMATGESIHTMSAIFVVEARGSRRRHKSRGAHMSEVFITVRLIPNGAHHTLFGRVAWALEQLINAGSAGCTPITHPGPRWSSYVHILRERGLVIDTLRESHGGQFPGTHARYVLRSRIEVLQSWRDGRCHVTEDACGGDGVARPLTCDTAQRRKGRLQ